MSTAKATFTAGLVQMRSGLSPHANLDSAVRLKLGDLVLCYTDSLIESKDESGQMLGMGPRDGWTGWDRIDALIPEAELSGLEAELRSQSQGLATYEAEFDHLAELNGPLAEKVIQQRVPEPA